MNASETTKPKKHPVGRFFAFIGVTLLCLIVTLLGMIWVLERGPSPTVSAIFTRSVRETSAIRWISNLFLTDQELEQYKSVSTEDIVTESVNTSLIHIEKAAEASSKTRFLRTVTSKTCPTPSGTSSTICAKTSKPSAMSIWKTRA